MSGRPTSSRTTDRKGFAIVPRWMVEDPSISGHAKLVYLALSSRIDEAGVCWPSHELLAREANAGVATVKRALQELRDLEIVTWSPRYDANGGRSSNAYKLHTSPMGPRPRRRAARRGSSRGSGGSLTPSQGTAHLERVTSPRERETPNDSFGRNGSSPVAAAVSSEGVPPVRVLVSTFVRLARERGFTDNDIRATAGLFGKCAKLALAFGATPVELEVAMRQILADAAADSAATNGGPSLGPSEIIAGFATLGVDGDALGRAT